MMRGPFVPIEDVSKHFSVSISTYIKVGNTYRFSIPDVSEALTSQHEDLVSFNEAGGRNIVASMADEMEAQAEFGIPDDHWSKQITADEDF